MVCSWMTQSRRRRFGPAGCALAVLLATALAGLPAYAQSLKQAVETSIKSNPQVTSNAALVRAAREEVTQARAGYLPSVDVGAGLGKERSDIPQTRALGLSSLTLDRQEAGVTVTQRLFDGNATRSEVQRQSARLDAASGRLTDTRETVALRTAEAFLEVLKNRELVRLAEESLRAHVDTQSKVELRVKAGVSQRADLQQAQGRVALSRSIVSARAGGLRTAEAAYVRVVGGMPTDLRAPETPPGSLVRAGAIDDSAVARAIRQSVDAANASSPALAVAAAELAAAEAATESAKAPFLPRVNIEVAANRNRNIGGSPGDVNNELAMLTLRWNLFRGGGDSAQERALAERRFAALDSVANTRREVEERVAVAIHRKATSEERLAFLVEHVAHSGEVLKSYQQQLELGRRSLLDVLNAENELFSARSSLTVGRYDDMLNHFAIQAAQGQLLKSLGVAAGD
jgi:adhesin transport system outer membrane protein